MDNAAKWVGRPLGNFSAPRSLVDVGEGPARIFWWFLHQISTDFSPFLWVPPSALTEEYSTLSYLLAICCYTILTTTTMNPVRRGARVQTLLVLLWYLPLVWLFGEVVFGMHTIWIPDFDYSGPPLWFSSRVHTGKCTTLPVVTSLPLVDAYIRVSIPMPCTGRHFISIPFWDLSIPPYKASWATFIAGLQSQKG